MNKPLYLFVGKSASGKTTVANLLEKDFEYKQIQSYTTRAPRYEGEVGHTFVTDAEFDKLGRLAAYTLYNGHKYGTTFEQIDECDIYVIDPYGVQTLLENYITNRKIFIVYFNTSIYNRIKRMLERGDHDNKIISRLLEDEKTDWLKTLRDIVAKATYKNKNVEMFVVDANKSISDVIDQFFFFTKF